MTTADAPDAAFVEVGDIDGRPVRIPVIAREPVDAATERRQREDVCRAAMSFVGAPYHHKGLTRAGGVDCATLLQVVAETARMIPAGLNLPTYSSQWHLHRHEEKLIKVLRALAIETGWPPKPGDIVCWKMFNTHCHASFALAWPKIVHADLRSKVVCVENLETAIWLTTVSERVPDQGQPRSRRVFTFWPQRKAA